MSARTDSLLQPRPTPIVAFMAVSLIVHVLFGLLLTVFSYLFSPPRMTFEQEPIKASLVRLGKKRDDKLLPRKEDTPPPPPAAEKAAPSAPAAPEKAVAIPSKEASKPEKKQESKGQPDAKKSLFNALTKVGKAEEVEGDEQGDKDGDSAKQEGERYYGLLASVVKRNYDVSNTIPEAERRTLKAVVTIRLGAAGELLGIDVTKSSGNELFDAAVLGAVKKTAPFGPPPTHLRDALKNGGVSLSFTPY